MIERSPGPAEHGLPIRRRPGWPSPDREYARRRRRWQCEPPPRRAAASPAPEPDEARDHARGNPSRGQSATSRSGRATSSAYRTHSPDLPIPVGAGPPAVPLASGPCRPEIPRWSSSTTSYASFSSDSRQPMTGMSTSGVPMWTRAPSTPGFTPPLIGGQCRAIRTSAMQPQSRRATPVLGGKQSRC